MDKKPEELAEIQNLPIPEFSERLTGLTLADLAALRELEAKEANRKDALEAIDEQVAKLEAAAAEANRDPSPSQTAQAEAAPATSDEVPAWQREDYAGPLDIEQASWRNAHLKPQSATTKPVKAPKTK
ncbi:hypothetical protein LJR143_001696 [Pseudoxanthomonas sp. LjRoot143]|uniref:hypothetical protein n=1 Tax=Pseudoxanthomonas sp. LjRoot143 TaxID=3342266 RepID=UPI003ED1293C